VANATHRRYFDDIPRAGHIVGYRFSDVVFHHRNMFVRRGMENNAGIEHSMDSGESIPVADVGDYGNEVNLGESSLQFLVDFEDRVLTVAE
jgi:hypothetical protein